jgi:hypothetical protein
MSLLDPKSQIATKNRLLKQFADVASNIHGDTAEDSAMRLDKACETLRQWAEEIRRDAEVINSYRTADKEAFGENK